jgi:hypothetical protein
VRALLSFILFANCSYAADAADGLPSPPRFKIPRSFTIPPPPDIKIYRYDSVGSNSTEPRDGPRQKKELPQGHPNETEMEKATSHESSQTLSPKDLTMKSKKGLWRGLDKLDRQLLKIALPLTATFAINPMVAAIDLFWVNRLGDALSVAGQAAANQVYGSFFWLFSFLPSVTATLVSQRHASGDTEGAQDAVCQALLIASCIAVTGTTFMFKSPERALSSILKGKLNKQRTTSVMN